MNPFSIVDAPTWLSLPEVSEDPTEHLEQLARLARLVDRLQEVAQYAPRLHETLPWLADVSVWDLILRLGAEGRFPNLSDVREFRDRSDPDVFPSERVSEREPVSPGRLRPSSHSTTTAATLLSFFAGVTQPVEQMIETLYLSPFLPDPITVWEILRRMARADGSKALPQDVVIGVCASLVRRRVDEMGRDRARPRLATWKITWRPIPLKLRWPQPSQLAQPLQGLQRSRRTQHPGFPQQSSRQQELLRRSCDPSGIEGIIKSCIVVVTEETVLNRATGYQPSGKILAFRCIPSNPGNPISVGSADDRNNTDNNGNVGKPRTTADPPTLTKAIETAVSLALFDALVFPLTFRGEFRRHISPPTLLRVQSPMPKAIRQAAHVWRTKVEEIAQHSKDSKQCTHSKGGRHCQRGNEGNEGKDGRSATAAPQQCDCAQGREGDWGWEWEKELTNLVLDPVRYLRILDRAVERAYGYAPFQTKQKAVHQVGWRWRMFPQDDPLLHYPGLRELLPSFPATVGEDGTVEWQGWHYRDHDEDLLRYFPRAQVTVRPSPLAEAAILVYWKGAILCYAVAEELRNVDASFRPYWFPYPRLGE